MQQTILLFIYATIHSFLVRMTYSTIVDYRICMLIFIATAVFSVYVNLCILQDRKFSSALRGFIFYLLAYFVMDKVFTLVFSAVLSIELPGGRLFNLAQDAFNMMIPVITFVVMIVVRLYVDARTAGRKSVRSIVPYINQILLAFVIPMVIVCTISLITDSWQTAHENDFNKKEWRTKIERRTEMLDNYLETIELIDLPRSRVEEDFGDPEFKEGENVFYYRMDSDKQVLKIQFADDKVSEYAIIDYEGEIPEEE